MDLRQNQVGLNATYEVLKQAGLDEWELVSVDNGIAYFKRPHPEYLAYLESESKKASKNRHSLV